jgi:hypothetical protein
MNKRFLIILAPLVLGGCTSVPAVINIPQGRFDVPETPGAKRASASLTYVGQEFGVEFSTDVANVAMNTTNPPILVRNAKSGFLGNGIALDIGYGLNDRFEVGFDMVRGLGVYAKYQLLGKPRSEAKRGNFSAALQVQADSLRQADTFNLASYDFSMTTTDLSVLGGFRPADNILVYGSYFQGAGSYSGSVSGGIFPGPYGGNMESTGYAAGVRFYFGDTTFFDVENVNTTLTVGQSRRTTSFIGARVGISY